MIKNNIFNFFIIATLFLLLIREFVFRDIYLANRLAHAEYKYSMSEEHVDTNLFIGPKLHIEDRTRLTFIWESKYMYKGKKLFKFIIVPRTIFAEVKVLGDGPWHEWFRDNMQFDNDTTIKNMN
jgi:hypothetical protein